MGPGDDGRRRPAAELLDAAVAAAALAGVSRISDITKLDRIGLPCWQAIRPESRSLSVHQGKGLTDAEAKVGAILEALEAYFAESFDAPSFRCAIGDLDPAVAPPALADFVIDTERPVSPAEPIDWVFVPRWGGGEVAVPWACVSMDFTVTLGTGLDRSSNGVAIGSSRDEAVFAALLELIERDAVIEWKAGSMTDRMLDQLDWSEIPYQWLHRWNERLLALGAYLRGYSIPSFSGIPVMVCELCDATKAATPFRAIHGQSAHPNPEIALFRAMVEAIQGRAAYIAGSRDDLLPDEYRHLSEAVRFAFAPPLPPGVDGKSIETVAPGPSTLSAVVGRLEEHGMGPIAIIDLGRSGPFHAVRVMALGLGNRQRRRRV